MSCLSFTSSVRVVDEHLANLKEIKLSVFNKRIYLKNSRYSYLACLCCCSQAWMNTIKFADSNHTGVDLMVQLQAEDWDQHDGTVLCGLGV